MFYYKIVKENENQELICTSVIMTESENKNPEYQASTEEEFKTICNKKYVNGEWVDIEMDIEDMEA